MRMPRARGKHYEPHPQSVTMAKGFLLLVVLLLVPGYRPQTPTGPASKLAGQLACLLHVAINYRPTKSNIVGGAKQ